MPGRSSLCLLAISLLSAPVLLRAQTSEPSVSIPQIARGLFAPSVPTTPSEITPPTFLHRPPIGRPPAWGLPQFARAAGLIFSGTVTAIARHPATHGQAIETVAITFRVENAIRGATPGESLTINQWIGLWSAGQRYRVGERVFLFLYPPSRIGLTSCVGGPVGRFNLDPSGGVLLSPQHLTAFRADPLLGGKSRVRFSDFALAVRRASEEE